MTNPVRARLRVTARADLRRPDYESGADVIWFCDFEDGITGVPVAASDVTFVVTLPDLSLLSPAPTPSLVAGTVGTWQVLIPSAAMIGDWYVQASCSNAGAVPDVRAFTVVDSTPAAASGDSAPAVKAVNGKGGPFPVLGVNDLDGVAEAVDAAATDAGAAAGEEAGALAGAAAAEPARIEAQVAAGAAGASATAAAGSAGTASAAAASVTATVVNAAVQRETLAALNLVSATDGAIGEVWGNNADRGRYRRVSGAWVHESRSFVDLDLAAPARTTALPAGIGYALTDPEGFIGVTLSIDGSTLTTLGLALSRQSDGTGRIARQDGLAPIDLFPNGDIRIGSSVRALADGTLRAGGQTLVDTTIGGWAVGDELGFILARANGGTGFEAGGFRLHVGDDGISRIIGADGVTLVSYTRGGTPVFTGAAPLLTVTHPAFDHVLADDLGFIAFAIRADGAPVGVGLALPPGVPPIPFTAAEISARNNRNLALAAAVARQREDHVARPTRRYSLMATVGQSLAAGFFGYPALSRTNRYAGLMMLGNSVHSRDEQDTVWTARGTAVLNPLIATVASRADTNLVLSDAEVLALAEGATNRGETVLEGGLAFLRRGWNDARAAVVDDSATRWVAGSIASSGNAIEEISKGASPERWGRVGSLANQVKTIATADGGATFGIGLWFFLQGEANYDGSRSGGSLVPSDATKAGYKALLKQYRADLRSDIEVAIAGMTRPAPFITYQTGDSFTRDDNDLSIGMAQWELSEEEPGWYLAAPNYPVTNVDGHLDSNGYRWLGQQMGKAAARVLVDGRRWRPLCPVSQTAAVVRGREILLDMHVPNPPLVWDLPYVVHTATDYAPSRGFVSVDSAGTNLVIASEIVAETVVKLTLTRAPASSARLRYADLTIHTGRGNLRDSDPTVASEIYEYVGGRQPSSANIAALVDKPYPLHNWCIAFSIPLVAG